MSQGRSEQLYTEAFNEDSDKVQLATELIATGDIYYLQLMAENVPGVPIGEILAHIGNTDVAYQILKKWYENREYLKIDVYAEHIMMYSAPALINDDRLYLSYFQPEKSKRIRFVKD